MVPRTRAPRSQPSCVTADDVPVASSIGHGNGLVRLALRPIRAQVSPPHDDLPAQGVVALFTEKRKVGGSPP
jgi:hypothetical protein